MKKLFLILSILIITSCHKPNSFRQEIWDEYFNDSFSDTKAVEVLVVTNRLEKTDNFGCNDENFGVKIGSNMEFGSCKINVPKNHNVGELPFTKDNRQSSHQYFKVLSDKSFDEKELVKILKQSKQKPLIFVHGFNVKYNEAILRAAQMAYDLKYQGPIVLFTWPSGAKDGFFDEARFNKTYQINLASAKESITSFKNFLLNLQKNEIQVNLLVHSMGHQVVLPALKQLSEENPQTIFIDNLILNAPDFEVNQFKYLTENLKQVSKHTTLYCSYNDKAMLASGNFNGNERLGACTFSEDFDSINVSLVDDETFGLGHSYYSSRAVLTDVFQALLGVPAEKRLFIIKAEPNSTEKYFLRK